MSPYSPAGLIWFYLKERRWTIGLFCLCSAIASVIFSLYALPWEAFWYGVALCGTAFLVAFLVDFVRYVQKHRTMQQLYGQIALGLDGLPKPKNLSEADYTLLLQALLEEKESLVCATNLTRNQAMDYYTLWMHQIKTPIAAMTLLLQAEQNETNRELEEELFKIEQYVEMALSYLRLDSDGNDLVIASYDLDGIVRQAVHKYASQFVRKKTSLHYEPLQTKALTDEKWLLFVLEQLLSNALKYTQTGCVSIYMDKNADCTLVIADTGIGIAPEDLPRVFEKGYTGYNGRSHTKSTGIGLYLCRRVLTKLSHTVCIQSEPGKGTKVLIDLSHIPLTTE